MKSTQTGSTSAAIEIDKAALQKVERIATWLHDQNRQEILTRFGVTVDDVDAENVPYEHPRYGPIRSAKSELNPIRPLSIEWKYQDRRSYEVDNFAALYRSIDEEPGDIVKITINTPYSQHGNLFITFSSSKYESTSVFRVSGEQHIVETVHQRLQRLFIDAGVSHAVLYGRVPSLIIRFGLGAAALLAILTATPFIKKHFGNDAVALVFALWGIPVGGTVFFFTDPLVAYFRNAFPRCFFKFGNQAKRVQDRRGAIALLVTSIVLPVLLAGIGLT